VKYSHRDVALLMMDRLEAYLAGDGDALEELKESLVHAGVTLETVQGAVAWLRAGVSGEAEELVPAERPRGPGGRVLSREERRVLSPDAFGFLLRLAAEGRLGSEQLESILARLGENEFPVELDEVQELAWRVATGETESESDLGATETTIH
jgi:uncharacterized protein Smg (DUF494 family)